MRGQVVWINPKNFEEIKVKEEQEEVKSLP